jgi:hypothetical protein|tara:strand:- start:10796 stop:11200 length:405 start_codon:yes stop_codon:yes gene_type:complete
MILEPQFTEQSGGYRLKDFMTSEMKSSEGQMIGGAPYEKMISDSLCIPYGLVSRFNNVDGTAHYGEIVDILEEAGSDVFEVPDILFDHFLQKVSVKGQHQHQRKKQISKKKIIIITKQKNKNKKNKTKRNKKKL